ncbi:hypothetical protein NK718_20740 [Alsobacter sp. SYSU M60028]|uniref:Uncharacterized protein n=1 Tax=Alsobacter ponti TaxID=2962936 RepID=A0ABT1LHQ1_9HYPH|nr:hypothetical protein [Alsobacter ponti]MCP8940959.1 hypothetical protein [Alsobacter ponti]
MRIPQLAAFAAVLALSAGHALAQDTATTRPAQETAAPAKPQEAAPAQTPAAAQPADLIMEDPNNCFEEGPAKTS